MKFFESHQNVTQRHKVSNRCWKNCSDGLGRQRVDTNSQFIKTKKQQESNNRKTVSAKHSKGKHDEKKYVCDTYRKNFYSIFLV